MLNEKLSLLYFLKNCGEFFHVYFFDAKESPVFYFSQEQKNKELSDMKNISHSELVICDFLHEITQKSYLDIKKNKKSSNYDTLYKNLIEVSLCNAFLCSSNPNDENQNKGYMVSVAISPENIENAIINIIEEESLLLKKQITLHEEHKALNVQRI